jgi:hypothetical protein
VQASLKLRGTPPLGGSQASEKRFPPRVLAGFLAFLSPGLPAPAVPALCRRRATPRRNARAKTSSLLAHTEADRPKSSHPCQKTPLESLDCSSTSVAAPPFGQFSPSNNCAKYLTLPRLACRNFCRRPNQEIRHKTCRASPCPHLSAWMSVQPAARLSSRAPVVSSGLTASARGGACRRLRPRGLVRQSQITGHPAPRLCPGNPLEVGGSISARPADGLSWGERAKLGPKARHSDRRGPAPGWIWQSGEGGARGTGARVPESERLAAARARRAHRQADR